MDTFKNYCINFSHLSTLFKMFTMSDYPNRLPGNTVFLYPGYGWMLLMVGVIVRSLCLKVAVSNMSTIIGSSVSLIFQFTQPQEL